MGAKECLFGTDGDQILFPEARSSKYIKTIGSFGHFDLRTLGQERCLENVKLRHLGLNQLDLTSSLSAVVENAPI